MQRSRWGFAAAVTLQRGLSLTGRDARETDAHLGLSGVSAALGLKLALLRRPQRQEKLPTSLNLLSPEAPLQQQGDSSKQQRDSSKQTAASSKETVCRRVCGCASLAAEKVAGAAVLGFSGIESHACRGAPFAAGGPI